MVFIFLFCFVLQLSLGQVEEDLLSKFHQKDYKMNFERLEAIGFEKDYVKEFKLITYKYNRTLPVSNFTIEFTVDVGNDLEILCQTYKLLSNQYRLFPARFQVNFCKMMKRNIAGLRSFTKDTFKCPIKKNVPCKIVNFYPDESMLPPFLPNGDFMVEMTFIHASKEVAAFRSFYTIYRPVVPK